MEDMGLMPPLTLGDGRLMIGGISLLDLGAEFGTPTYVTDEQRIRSNCSRLKAAFGRAYGKFRLNYAVKANNNISILNIIRQEGAGADCSCVEELELAKLAGFSQDKMLYSGNYNSADELSRGIDSGAAVNLDDIDLLPSLLKFGNPEVLSFRVNPGIGAGQYPGLVFGGENTKFGIEESQISKAYEQAKEAGIGRLGIHMMTGSNVLKADYFESVARKLFDMAEKIAQTVGIIFEFVNIGGGFGVPYRPDDPALDIETVGAAVGATFAQYVERALIGEPYLMIEPGRFIVADSTVLIGRVHHIKRTQKRIFVGTDIGMNTILRPALYGAYHHIYIANRPTAEPECTATVTGQVCENTDILARDRPLPRVEVGDLIAVTTAGAYGYSMSSQYNSRPRPAEVLVNKGSADVIREREAVRDFMLRQRIPERLLT